MRLEVSELPRSNRSRRELSRQSESEINGRVYKLLDL